ncbi:hypothetical protein IWQ60_011137 [Tieghemiomyces parasiticus]|uniref:Uncharacterized protein n=1 Tax=Tieghemiomyces parasiticus TaxID=78921 RepID=A0A9W7ZHV0_9FUNG|nr:hypothetical protein IWQ60_011137 [Tieghemiomyces parasiticus]
MGMVTLAAALPAQNLLNDNTISDTNDPNKNSRNFPLSQSTDDSDIIIVNPPLDPPSADTITVNPPLSQSPTSKPSSSDGFLVAARRRILNMVGIRPDQTSPANLDGTDLRKPELTPSQKGMVDRIVDALSILPLPIFIKNTLGLPIPQDLKAPSKEPSFMSRQAYRLINSASNGLKLSTKTLEKLRKVVRLEAMDRVIRDRRTAEIKAGLDETVGKLAASSSSLISPPSVSGQHSYPSIQLGEYGIPIDLQMKAENSRRDAAVASASPLESGSTAVKSDPRKLTAEEEGNLKSYQLTDFTIPPPSSKYNPGYKTTVEELPDENEGQETTAQDDSLYDLIQREVQLPVNQPPLDTEPTAERDGIQDKDRDNPPSSNYNEHLRYETNLDNVPSRSPSLVSNPVSGSEDDSDLSSYSDDNASIKSATTASTASGRSALGFLKKFQSANGLPPKATANIGLATSDPSSLISNGILDAEDDSDLSSLSSYNDDNASINSATTSSTASGRSALELLKELQKDNGLPPPKANVRLTTPDSRHETNLDNVSSRPPSLISNTISDSEDDSDLSSYSDDNASIKSGAMSPTSFGQSALGLLKKFQNANNGLPPKANIGITTPDTYSQISTVAAAT